MYKIFECTNYFLYFDFWISNVVSFIILNLDFSYFIIITHVFFNLIVTKYKKSVQAFRIIEIGKTRSTLFHE